MVGEVRRLEEIVGKGRGEYKNLYITIMFGLLSRH